MNGRCTEIRPYQPFAFADLRELWERRDLIWILALRDIRTRYKQSVLGILWVMAPPLLTVSIFHVLFGILLGPGQRPTVPGVPYVLSTFCALVPWQLFATSLKYSGNSLVSNRNLISKVYFPRLVVPVAPIIVALVDCAVAFVVLLGLMAAFSLAGEFEFGAGARSLSLPLFVLLAVSTSLALSLWASALSAVYRDFSFLSPFTIQILMYLTPVLYTYGSIAQSLGEGGRLLYGLNPMVAVVEGFRWALLGGAFPEAQLLFSAGAVNVVLLLGGIIFFHRMEQTIVDVI